MAVTTAAIKKAIVIYITIAFIYSSNSIISFYGHRNDF